MVKMNILILLTEHDTTMSSMLYTHHPALCADRTIQWAVCCTHTTPCCDPIKKSATSIEHGISLQIYNVLPSASSTEAPHSISVTPISILSSHYNYPAASDNNLSTVLIFPTQPGYKSHSSHCGTCKWCCYWMHSSWYFTTPAWTASA